MVSFVDVLVKAPQSQTLSPKPCSKVQPAEISIWLSSLTPGSLKAPGSQSQVTCGSQGPGPPS